MTMRSRLFFGLSLILLSTIQVFAQAENGYFQVSFNDFSPPEKELINSFVDRKATPFLANDVNGAERFLGTYKGKSLVLAFMAIEEASSQRMLSMLDLLEDQQIVIFMEDDKAAINNYYGNNSFEFTTIPNGKIFGEMAYGADLGRTRVFFIDRSGIIQYVLPQSAIEKHENLYLEITKMLSGL